jgi:hypothetical protein
LPPCLAHTAATRIKTKRTGPRVSESHAARLSHALQPRAIRQQVRKPALAVGIRSADRRPRAATVLMFRAALGAGRIGFIPSDALASSFHSTRRKRARARQGKALGQENPARQHGTLRFLHRASFSAETGTRSWRSRPDVCALAPPAPHCVDTSLSQNERSNFC